MNWIIHAKLSDLSAASILPLALQLLQIDQQAYRNWHHLYDMFDQHEKHRYFRFSYIAHPLYMMSHAGAVNMVRHLLKRDADVKAGNEERLGYALVGASQQGHLDIVQMLLDHGADPDAVIISSQARDYAAALQAASGLGYEDIARLLIDHGANVDLTIPKSGCGSTALEAASARGHRTIVQLLLSAGADNLRLKREEDLRLKNEESIRLKHEEWISETRLKTEESIRLKHEEWISEMRTRKNTSSGEKQEALEVAAYDGNLMGVRCLLDKGANPSIISQTPFQGALIAAACSVWNRESAPEIAKILIENGADVNAVSKNYNTALQAALRLPFPAVSRNLSLTRRYKFIEILIDNGADVNAHGIYGETALVLASEQFDERVVKLLLDNGADPNPPNKSLTALDGALVSMRHWGPRLAFDEDKLIGSLSGPSAKVVQLLLDFGAETHVMNKTDIVLTFGKDWTLSPLYRYLFD